MTLDDLRGQEQAVGILRRALERGRLAHALIFAGPSGVGKRTAAHALAAALLCREAPGRGCGSCEDCHLVATQAHPDLVLEDLERAREEKPTATRLSIDQMRRVRSRLAMRGVRGERKVGIIDQAELLTIDAQNALLKTLEEPPGKTALLLICPHPDALLSTIRSRCQCVRFAPLEKGILTEILIGEGVEAESAESAAALAEGSLDRARTLTADDGLAYTRELRDKLGALPGTSIPHLLDLAAELAGPRGEKGRARQQLNRAVTLDWCRDHLLDAARAVGTPPEDETDEPHEGLDELRRALQRAEIAYATTREFERNANAHLAWDRLLLGLRGAR